MLFNFCVSVVFSSKSDWEIFFSPILRWKVVIFFSPNTSEAQWLGIIRRQKWNVYSICIEKWNKKVNDSHLQCAKSICWKRGKKWEACHKCRLLYIYRARLAVWWNGGKKSSNVKLFFYGSLYSINKLSIFFLNAKIRYGFCRNRKNL